MSVMDNFNNNSYYNYGQQHQHGCQPWPPVPISPPPPPGHHVCLGDKVTISKDYDELKDKPITNLIGLKYAINLATLEPGNYNVKGNYIFAENDYTLKTFPGPQMVYVTKDTSTEKKCIYYNFFRGDFQYARSIVYTDDVNYKVEDSRIGDDALKTYEELPSTGIVGRLYVTNSGVYVWDGENEKFKILGLQETEWTII